MQPSQRFTQSSQAAPARLPSAERGGQTVWAWRLRYSLPMVATTVLLLACGDSAETCPEGYTCTPDGGGGSSTTASTTSASTGGSGGGTTTTGLPMECDPLLLQPNQSLDPSCGLFVEPGAPTGDGSQAMPYGTLTDALAANPMNKPVYVCSTGPSLNEPIELSASERLVGAVTCGDWKATPTKTAWTAGENEVVLTLSATTNAHVQGFAITSANATGFDAADGDGNDSIAVIADGGVATLLQVDIVAGNGAAGGAGADQSGQAPGRQSDAMSFDGNAGGACGVDGGATKAFAACPAGGTTTGGKGGDGDLALGSPGNPGTPDPLMSNPNGDGGVGEPSMGGFDCSVNGGHGENGHPGPAGNAGLSGTAVATVAITGLTGQPGGDGGNGTIGQGGGGGGGRKGNGSNGCLAGVTGPSGGSGGAGGCGGLAGQGGGQGGASIALLSLGAMLTLTDVTLTAGLGGAGGEGGDGQFGGQGGFGAAGGGSPVQACTGGAGGTGGTGGPGGGGAGGASLGLAYTGTAPELDDSAITVSATPAAGGAGGNANASGNAGAAGLTAKKQGY